MFLIVNPSQICYSCIKIVMKIFRVDLMRYLFSQRFFFTKQDYHAQHVTTGSSMLVIHSWTIARLGKEIIFMMSSVYFLKGQVPRVRFQGLGSKVWVPRVRFQGLGSNGQVPRVGFQGLGSKGYVPRVRFQGLGSKGWVPRVRFQGLGSKHN